MVKREKNCHTFRDLGGRGESVNNAQELLTECGLFDSTSCSFVLPLVPIAAC